MATDLFFFAKLLYKSKGLLYNRSAPIVVATLPSPSRSGLVAERSNAEDLNGDGSFFLPNFCTNQRDYCIIEALQLLFQCYTNQRDYCLIEAVQLLFQNFVRHRYLFPKGAQVQILPSPVLGWWRSGLTRKT